MHFSANTLAESLGVSNERPQRSPLSTETLESIHLELPNEWSKFKNAITPLLKNFVVNCGPRKTLGHLFVGMRESLVEEMLDLAQDHWRTSRKVDQQLANISRQIKLVEDALAGVQKCKKLDSNCTSLVDLDESLDELANLISELPPEGSV